MKSSKFHLIIIPQFTLTVMIIIMNNNEIALMRGYLVTSTVLSTLLKTFCPYSNPTRSYSRYLVLVFRQGADT